MREDRGNRRCFARFESAYGKAALMEVIARLFYSSLNSARITRLPRFSFHPIVSRTTRTARERFERTPCKALPVRGLGNTLSVALLAENAFQ